MPHEVFDAHPERYDRWYDDHRAAYLEELKIIGNILGVRGADGEGSSEGGSVGPDLEQRSCENPTLERPAIRRGATWRSASGPAGSPPLSASGSASIPPFPCSGGARARGIEVIRGMAENLPLKKASVKSILVMTSLCYFDDPRQAFQEIHRVLTPGGSLTIGFLGRGGAIADHYLETREKGTFLSHATFYTPVEVASLLAGAGFTGREVQDTGGASVKGFHVMTATRQEG